MFTVSKLQDRSETLIQQLDRAAYSIQPERFITPEGAKSAIQPILSKLNIIMGNEDSSSSLDYENWLNSIEEFMQADLLKELKSIFEGSEDDIVLALIGAAEFDLILRNGKLVIPEDLRDQLVSFTLKLVEYINQGGIAFNSEIEVSSQALVHEA